METEFINDSKQMDIVEDLGFELLNKNNRVTVKIVKTHGRRYLMILKEFRRDTWPKGAWKRKKSYPLMDLKTFKFFKSLIKLRGTEIEEKLSEETESESRVQIITSAPDFA